MAYNLPAETNQSCGYEEVPDGECQFERPSSGSEIIIFLSLIAPSEEPDEFSWIKWPMLGFGVGAFLLYKIFFPGTKFPKKNSSRFSRQNLVGSPRDQPGRYNSADVTAELRRELDDLDQM